VRATPEDVAEPTHCGHGWALDMECERCGDEPLPERAVVELRRLRTLRPLADWHEDHGAVLWWHLPIAELPHVGWGPGLDEDFDAEFYTHWSPLPAVRERTP
jgi:hypothetical protein